MDFNALKGGVYEDLTPFMLGSNFNEDDFLKGAISGGQFYGKQYLVPVSFEAHTYITSEQALKNIGVDSSLISSEALSEKITLSLKSGKISEVFGQTNNYMSDFLMCLGTDLIDYEKDEINISTNESKAYLDNVKLIANASWRFGKTNPGDNYSVGAQKIADGEMLFMETISPNLLLAAGMAVNHNATLVFMPMRNEQLEIIASPVLQAGVSSMSANKQNAYNFIEILLSEEFQCSSFLQDTQMTASPSAGKPVRISAFEKRIKESDYPKSIAIFDQEYQAGDYKELSQEQLDSYISLMNGGMEINFFRSDYHNLSTEIFEYIFKNASLDNILSSFENKLKIKMNE